MNDLVLEMTDKLLRLRVALAQQTRPQIDRTIGAIERDLLESQNYRHIWDERLLGEAASLLSRCYGEEQKHRLDELYRHLAVVRVVHNKLCAILDPDIELGELLFVHLDEWSPLLDEPIGCQFDENAKASLHEARITDDTGQGLGDFMCTYFQRLRDKKLTTAADTLQLPVKLAIEGYRRAHEWTVHGLFVTSNDQGEVRGLRIRPEAGGDGGIKCLNRIGPDMETAANRALACVRGLWPHTGPWTFTWEIEGGEVAFVGDSIGLALTIGILAAVESFDVDAYTAFTGLVDWATGEIGHVEHLDAKLHAAAGHGIRRAFIPRQNEKVVGDSGQISTISVESVQETRERLRQRTYEQAHTPYERLVNARIRELEIVLNAQGIRMTGSPVQRDATCKRAAFTNYRENVFVDVFYGRRGLNPSVQAKNTPLRQVIQGACDAVFGERPRESQPGAGERSRSKYVVSSPSDQQRIQDYILGRDDSIRETEDNCAYRAKIVSTHQTVFVRQFTRGTLTVEGPPPPSPLFEEIDGNIRAILGAPEAYLNEDEEHRVRLRAQIEAVESVQLGEQWIGTDESGKGDYYGPLVGAAVLVDERTAQLLSALGVRDSKTLSDKRVCALAEQVHRICGKRAAVVPIPPERYNELYRQFRAEGKNLNTLLAWAHTRALEDILSEYPLVRVTVLVDKFADERYIRDKLLEKGRQTNLDLVQLPKAEANIAVAAASVIARAQFLQWVERLSGQYGIEFPKGASDPRIIEIGEQLVARFGRDELARVAKLHFKITERILARD